MKERWQLLFLLLLAGMTATANGLAAILDDNANVVAIEYFGPVKQSRDIHALNANYDYLLAELDESGLLLYFDVTATYATGEITQLEGSINDGDYQKVRYHNTAFGIGPGFFSSYRFYEKNDWSFHLDGGWNTILYNKAFPAGGDRYNFMVKVGPMAEYRFANGKALGIHLMWTHISNGQGLGNHNPSYEAQGIGFRLKGFI